MSEQSSLVRSIEERKGKKAKAKAKAEQARAHADATLSLHYRRRGNKREKPMSYFKILGVGAVILSIVILTSKKTRVALAYILAPSASDQTEQVLLSEVDSAQPESKNDEDGLTPLDIQGHARHAVSECIDLKD